MNQTDEANLDKDNQRQVVSSYVCNQCRKELEAGSVKCHHCESHQNRFVRWLVYVPVAVVLLTIIQLGLVFKERVETSRILDDVTALEKKSNSILSDVEEREKLITKRLTEVDDRVKLIDTSIQNTEKDIVEKVGKLSQNISDINNETTSMIELMARKVDGQIIDSKNRLSKAEDDFNRKNQTITDELHDLKIELSNELDKLKWRDELMVLTDKSISEGDRLSFNKLVKIRNDLIGTEKQKIVTSYLLQVKGFYIGMRRYGGIFLKKNGVLATNDAWTTKEKINFLLTSKDKIVRFKMAELLGKVKELGVPEALVNSVENDTSLDVVARSNRSFASLITDYTSVDVFGGEHLLSYWYSNKNDIKKKLKKRAEVTQ